MDLCAAPGGKTMQLAARGAKVTAVEIDAARAARIAENLARTKLSAEIVESDARDYQGRAPLVLIDAPCTATGTIRRHPDLPWIKGAADVTVSAAAAYEILEGGAAMVEPGGVWYLPSARWSARKAKSRSRRSCPRIRNFPARRSRRTKCSATANGSRRMAICAPCPVTSATKAAWMGFMRRG